MLRHILLSIVPQLNQKPTVGHWAAWLSNKPGFILYTQHQSPYVPVTFIVTGFFRPRCSRFMYICPPGVWLLIVSRVIGLFIWWLDVSRTCLSCSFLFNVNSRSNPQPNVVGGCVVIILQLDYTSMFVENHFTRCLFTYFDSGTHI